MMWVLVVAAIDGGITAATQSSLEQCERSFQISAQNSMIVIDTVRDAYCQSATGDRVWIVKDGRQFGEALK